MANTNVTILKARVSTSELPERIQGYTHKFNVKYTDVNTGAGSTDTITLAIGNTPKNWVCTRAIANVVTPFTGTTSFTMAVGTTSSAAAFLVATAVQGASVLIQPTTGANTTAVIAASTGSSSVVMQAVFTNAVGGSPSALTAGEVNVYLSLVDLDQLP